MQPPKLPQLPKQTLVKVSACLAMTLVVILVLVYPEYAALEENDLAVAALRREIEVQKTFTPLFREMLKKSRLKDSGSLVVPERKPWPGERTTELVSWLEQTGRNRRLAVEVRLPDGAALAQQGALLPMDVVATGAFVDFRAFWVDLCQASFVAHIERIQILADDLDQQLRLKLWIAQG